ncbi:MAG: WD40 repeat domain-containing protein [Pirellulales bacterium]
MRMYIFSLSALCLSLGSIAWSADPPAKSTKIDGFNRWVIAADFTTDGTSLVTAGGESLLYRPGDVVVWKADGSRIGDLAGHPTAVWAVKVSNDGKLAATAGYDGLVKLWDFPNRKLKNDLKKHKGWVRSLDFSPDGTKLATAGEDGTVIVWNTADGAEIKTIKAHEGPVTAIEFSPDGTVLASGGGDKIVKLWDAASGAEKGKLAGHEDTIWAVAFSPDNTTLASASADRSIKLWNMSDKKARATLKGHKDWVTSIAFSSDNARLVSGSLNGETKLWDVKSGGEQEGPANEKSSIWCVSFSPDAKRLFVGTHKGGKLIAVPAVKLLAPPPPPAPKPKPVAEVQSTSIALVPTAFTSKAGAKGVIDKDGTIMVSGTLAKDTYTMKASVPKGVNPRAIRLDVLPDPSLPGQGPGRSSGGGNFVISTLSVSFGAPGKPETPTKIKFSGAKADFEQANYAVAGALDDNPESGWAIAGGTGKAHHAIFDIAGDVKVLPEAPLTITIDQQYQDGTHALGKFRFSMIPTEAPKK